VIDNLIILCCTELVLLVFVVFIYRRSATVVEVLAPERFVGLKCCYM